MRIAIVDDERAASDDLNAKLNAFLEQRGQNKAEITLYSSGRQILAGADGYDIMFLDIVMPGPDGLTSAPNMRRAGYSGVLIFTTVLKDYVFDAFSVEAADYLLKPVDPERLASVMDRVLERMESEERKEIVLKQGRATIVIHPEKVEYCEVIGRRLELHRTDGSVVSSRGSAEDANRQRFAVRHRPPTSDPDDTSRFIITNIYRQKEGRDIGKHLVLVVVPDITASYTDPVSGHLRTLRAHYVCGRE